MVKDLFQFLLCSIHLVLRDASCFMLSWLREILHTTQTCHSYLILLSVQQQISHNLELFGHRHTNRPPPSFAWYMIINIWGRAHRAGDLFYSRGNESSRTVWIYLLPAYDMQCECLNLCLCVEEKKRLHLCEGIHGSIYALLYLCAQISPCVSQSQ